MAGREGGPPADRARPPESVFSIDVEDWFHILQVPGVPQITWDPLPSYVEKDFMRILDLLQENGVRSTCFFLGWVAKRYPHLVQAAVHRGHEIASHGYAHRLVFQMTARRFRQDSIEAREILEDIAGCKVRGYRAAGFSVIDKTPWFFDTLIRGRLRIRFLGFSRVARSWRHGQGHTRPASDRLQIGIASGIPHQRF